MDTIFHEKQEGSLCAQHCLNTLLQGSYFTAVDLSQLAQQLDESERQQMAVAGMHSDAYQTFIAQPSSNMDDSGFFSVQVIAKALSVWGLDMVPYNSQDSVAVAARSNPCNQKAYICNFREHWLAVRKLGNQWFNLNSLLTGPELISDTFLSMFLVQLQQEGYSLFVIVGSLPDCEADQILHISPAYQPIKPNLINEDSDTKQDKDGDSLQEDNELQQAIQMSISDMASTQSSNPSSTVLTAEEIRQRRLAYLSQVDTEQVDSLQHNTQSNSDPTEEEMLQQAIKMSMEST